MLLAHDRCHPNRRPPVGSGDVLHLAPKKGTCKQNPACGFAQALAQCALPRQNSCKTVGTHGTFDRDPLREGTSSRTSAFVLARRATELFLVADHLAGRGARVAENLVGLLELVPITSSKAVTSAAPKRVKWHESYGLGVHIVLPVRVTVDDDG